MRPPLYEGPRSLLQRVGRKLRALTLRLTVLNQIRQIVRAQKIDVVCIGELEANGWLAPWCRRLFGVPTMIYVHGEEVNRRTNWRNEDATRQKSLRAAAAIIAVSRYTQDIICQKYHIERDRVHLVPNAVDAGRFAPSLAARPAQPPRRRLLSVGRLLERKGFDAVLSALPALIETYPEIHYDIIGAGPSETDLADQIKRLGLQRNVTLRGEVSEDELLKAYATHDIFVMPNRETASGDTEGFGLVFLEANAAGMPVIAGDAGGAPDAVTDGENGLVVNGHSVDQIATALQRLIADDDLYARLAKGAVQRARQATWAASYATFQTVIDRIAERGRKLPRATGSR